MIKVDLSLRIFLDTNAVRYCFESTKLSVPQKDDLRRRLRKGSAENTLSVVASTHVGWELTSIAIEDKDLAFYRDIARFYSYICKDHCLMDEPERRRQELLRRGRIPDSEVFFLCDLARTRALAADLTLIRASYEMQRKAKDDELAEEPGKRTEAVKALNAGSANWKDEIKTADWKRTVEDYVRLELKRSAQSFKLNIPGWRWPRPTDVPTFWFGESFYLAKSRDVFVDTQKQLVSKKSLKTMPGMFDVAIFRDCAYVDALVTDDQNFARIAGNARTPLKIFSFDDFAAEVFAASFLD